MEGVFTTVSGITMVVCAISGIVLIFWVMSFAHKHDDKHDDSQ